jgi:predicted RNA-binding Zn-ribbon protein involved in translation (DUF1610 family)
MAVYQRGSGTFMNCTACQAHVPEGEFLCPACGTAVIPQSTEMQQRANRFGSRTNTNSRWLFRGGWIGFAIGAGLSLIIAVVLQFAGDELPPKVMLKLYMRLIYFSFGIAAFGVMAGMFVNLYQSVMKPKGDFTENSRNTR